MPDQQLTTSNSTSSTADNAFDGFHQLADGLSQAMGELNKLRSNNGFQPLFNAIKPIGDYAKRAFNFTAGYSRRHPVRIAITVASIGFLIAAAVTKASTTEKQPETLH